jgi:ubiquinone/menaquinone biosynthesis C-methylase UbiE
MPNPINPRENRTTYAINPQDPNETARLLLLDELVTQEMGGVFPPDIDLSNVCSVLDLACGPGGWALQVSREYPAIDVVGVDISEKMIRYANAQADALDLEHVSFQVMNILQSLEFPDASFDIVNARQIFGFMPNTAWPGLVRECFRVTRPGGYIRFTEAEHAVSTSTAYEQLASQTIRALWLAGQGFHPEGKLFNITLMVAKFLRDAGLQDIRHQAFTVDFSYGTPAYESWYEASQMLYPLLFPFLQSKGTITQEEFDQLYPQCLEEMSDPSFRGMYFLVSAWGRKPIRE